MLSRILKTLLCTFVAVFLLVFLLIYAAIDSQPQTLFVKPLDAAAAQESKKLALKLRQTFSHNSAYKVVKVTAAELSSLLSLMHRAIPQIVGNAVLIKDEAYFDFSIAFPLFSKNSPHYINASASVFTSSRGLVLGDITVGSIQLNGQKVLRFLVWLVDSYTGKDSAQKLVGSIKSTNINAKRMYVQAYWDKEQLALDNENSLLSSIRDHLALFGDVNRVQHYLDSLVLYARSHNEQTASETAPNRARKNSLAPFINALFKQVEHEHSNKNSSVNLSFALENKATLAALVLYFGDDRFSIATGELSPLSPTDKLIREQLKRTVTLQNRVDLQKHFIYSIALQLFSSHYASDALGEFKELLDTNKGGSGFSFADLQADRAGTRLAMVATYSDEAALSAQAILAQANEEALMPSIKGLEEGLDKSKFNQKYIHINSIDYHKSVSIIDKRLALLPIYQIKGVALF